MKITVTNLRRDDRPDSATIATASVVIDGLVTLYGLRLMRGKEGGSWLSEAADKSETTGKYWKHYQLTDDCLRGDITRAVRAALDEPDSGSPDEPPAYDDNIPY